MGWESSVLAEHLQELTIPSTADGSAQPARLLAAQAPGPRPLLIALHTWGGDWRQNLDGYFTEGHRRGWHCVAPNFRGPNRTPEACGSPLARQDILDALDHVLANADVDPRRIYLAGGSGGGHMTMRMVGAHPDRFAAASAWCGIADLAAWHRENLERDPANGYAPSIEACIGGAPGASPEVDAQVRERSPLFHIHHAAGVPLDLNHGVRDGRDGSVPFWHSVWAYNILAKARGDEPIRQDEIDQLWTAGRLAAPRDTDRAADPLYAAHPVLLRRATGHTRLTIFDGAHHVLPATAIAWLSRHRRDADGKIHVAEDDNPPADSSPLEQIGG